MTDLLIKNAKLLCIDGILRIKDILIENDKIKSIQNCIKINDYDEIFNANKNIIIPSGIDTNVHISNIENKNEWYNCSCSAASGGFTTIINQQNENYFVSNKKSFDIINNYAKSKSIIDYIINVGFSGNINDIYTLNNEEIFGIGEIPIEKYTLNLKEYILEIRKQNLIFCIHTENNPQHKNNTFSNIYQLIKDEIYNIEKLNNFFKVNNNIKNYKKNTKLHFCSIYTEKLLEYIIHQKYISSYKITCETSPYQLFLDQSNKSINETKYFINNLNNIDVISSGSSIKNESFYLQDFSMLEITIPLMLYAVHKNYTTLSNVIRLTSYNPSKIFNIKNKGLIQINYDADLLIYNPKNIQKIKAENFISNCEWTPYENMNCIFPEATISRGKIIFIDKQIVYKKGRGHLIQRG